MPVGKDISEQTIIPGCVDVAVKTRELSWSISRARMFEECPRRYYYQWYFSKLGIYPDAPEEAVLAAEMAQIKGIDMWAGEVVHQVIQWTLEQTQLGYIPTIQEVRAETRRKLSDGWMGSLKQLWRTNHKDVYPSIFEHYYGLSLGAAATDRIKNKAFTSVENFLASDIYRRVTLTPVGHWLPIEKYASFRLDGLLLYVKFDFAIKDGQYITIYDWKTGRPTIEENKQLACYGLYAATRWETPIENVKVCAVHLQPELQISEKSVEEEDIEDARALIKQSFSAMLGCLRNPARNLAVMDDFPLTGNLVRCTRCSFRGICAQGKQAVGDIDNIPIAEDWDS